MRRFLSLVLWLSVCSVCSVGTLRSQPAPVQADPTTGALTRPTTATFVSGNSLLTPTSTSTLTNKSISGATNTLTAIPLTTAVTGTLPVANGGTGVSTSTGTGSVVLSAGPTLTGTIGAASLTLSSLTSGRVPYVTTAGLLTDASTLTFNAGTLTASAYIGASVTAPASTDLTLSGGSSGASLVLGQGTNADATIAYKGTGKVAFNRWVAASATAPAALAAGAGSIYFQANGSVAGTQDSWVFDTGYTDQSYRFKVAGTDKMVIAANTGNLLIGTTTDAASLAGGLVVNGSGAGAAASSTTTGALRVTGGVGVSGAGYFGGDITMTRGASGGYFSIVTSGTTAEQGVLFTDSGGASGVLLYTHSTDTMALNAGGATRLSLTSAAANIPITTPASSSTVGALTIGNGTAATNVGIGGGNINAGGTLTVGGAATFAGAVTTTLGIIGASGEKASLVMTNAGANYMGIGAGTTGGRSSFKIGTTAALAGNQSFASEVFSVNDLGAATFAGAVTHTLGTNLPPQTAPASPASGWTLYTDSGDGNKLKAKASTGTVVTIGTP